MTRIRTEHLNASIRGIPLPDNMRERPVSKEGYPVPYFAGHHPDTGEWDFRVVYPETFVECLRLNICWICGQAMGRRKAFVSGPMCVVTKTTAEPPSHLSCARYAAVACPFLAQPRMKRNDKDLPEGHQNPAGIMLLRNPGVAAVLITESMRPFQDDEGRLLLRMGDPQAIEWYAQRRRATRIEVAESIKSGIGLLVEQCEMEDTERDRAEAYHMLESQLASALAWLPPADGAGADPVENMLPKR